jgi:hypothetical protein
MGTVARSCVAGPVITTSAVSGTAASGGVSRSRNAWVPSADTCDGSAAGTATCQFPLPSLSHQEKPGFQLCANRWQSGDMPLATTCRWLSPAAMLSPASANRAPSTSGRIRASGTYASGPSANDGARCAMTLAHRSGSCAAAGTVMPCPVAPSRWHRAASWPGTRLSAAIVPVSVSTVMISPGAGPSRGPLASPLARMRSASSTSRRSAGGIGAGWAVDGATWRPRAVAGRSGIWTREAPSAIRSSFPASGGGIGDSRMTPRQAVRSPVPPQNPAS